MAKFLIICRGCAGSGKSTLAEKVVRWANESNILSAYCSTDDFFYVNGEYKFDRRKLGEYHRCCREFCELNASHDVPIIIVDNTNTTYKEVKPYLEIANNYGYDVRFLESTERIPVELCISRNIHNVPADTVRQQYNRYQDGLQFLLEELNDRCLR